MNAAGRPVSHALRPLGRRRLEVEVVKDVALLILVALAILVALPALIDLAAAGS